VSNAIHPSAIISGRARLGKNNTIGAHVIIDDEVQLGDSNVLMAGVVLKAGTRMGSNNTVHEYAVLGGLPQDIHFDAAIPSWLEIGDRNTLREYVTLNRASQENAVTRIGNDNYLMTQVHLGHDCVLGDQIIIAPGSALAGFVNLARRVFVSGGVMVHQFVNIGELAMVGGNAKITRDVLPYMITDGIPARVRGLNLVGLERAGFSPEDILTLKRVYRLIHRSGKTQSAIVAGLRDMASHFSNELADFIVDSRRGYHREK
jgi:UDP-N-acetylglucosamine acyltransferase